MNRRLSKHDGYTKIEYIKNSQCIDSQKFSHHYGALIFTLVLLRGVDFHSEINDLSNLDIPYFYFQNGKLFNAEDTEIKQNFLRTSFNDIVQDVIDLEQFKNNLIKTMEI